MATNGTNTSEDAEMVEYDGDKVVTMLDVLQEEQDFEEDANAVLGASDDKNCSFNKGYIKRQAIYACMTCCSDAKIDPLKRAGVCLACSLTCHENHELIELYTKRNFRCDCGNAKFNSHPCQFNANKTELNEDNTYNQNYSGLYCTCHRPYPDPDSTTEDEMIQCVICEDWLHASHLDAVVPDEAYAEMICNNCMEKNNFLHDYSSLAITAENIDVDVVNSSGAAPLSNGIPESEVTLEEIKEQDIEMKDGADVNVSEPTSAEVAPETKNTNETEINSESDTMNSTNELEKVESKDTSNEIYTTPEIEGKANSPIETVEAKTEEDQLTEGGVSENTTLSPDQNETDCKSDLPDNKSLTVFKETNVDGAKCVNKEGSVEPSPQKTNVTTADKAKSDNDIPVTDVKESNDIRDYELELEEELLKEPSDIKEPNDQQEEGIKITNSNIENDKEPVMDTNNERVTDSPNEAANDTSNEPTMDTSNAPAMDTSHEPAMDTSNAPAMDTSIAPAMDTSNAPAMDTSIAPAMNTTNAPAMDTSNEPAMDTSNEPAMDTSNEPAMDTSNESAIDTTNEPVIDKTTEAVSATENVPPIETSPDTKDATEMDVKKKEEIDSSKTELQTGPDNPETRNVQKSKLESTNTGETDAEQDGITKEETFTKEDSINIEKDSTKDETNNKTNTENVDETVSSSNENKRKLSILDKDDGAKRIKPNESKSCIRPKGKRHLKGATFWPSNFRQKLCTCNECLSMYKDLSVLFLIDSEDTVAAYEMLGKERSNGNSQYEKGLQALSSLDRIQQINAVTEYNKMREKLSDFLKSFMLKKEVVKEEDIKAFFAGMKPKREPDGVYFCR